MTGHNPSAQVPRIRVEAGHLDAGTSLLVYDHPEVLRMILDQRAPAEVIAAALQTHYRRTAGEGLWVRTPNPAHLLTA